MKNEKNIKDEGSLNGILFLLSKQLSEAAALIIIYITEKGSFRWNNKFGFSLCLCTVASPKSWSLT